MIDPETIGVISQQLGLGVAANAIYDEIRSYFASEPHPTRGKLTEHLQSRITIDRQDVWADKLIELLAERGDIVVSESEVRAPGLRMAAEDGSAIRVGRGSRVRGSGFGIDSDPAGQLSIESEPGSRVSVEGEDGDLRFKTGR